MFTDQKFKDFFSGLVAGVISVTACNPLDIARTRLNIMSSPNHSGNKYMNFGHTLRVMWREEGLRGFYTGYKVNVKAIPVFHSLFFPIYETMKHLCSDKGMGKYTQYFVSSIFAGGICNLITNPIWVVRTRIMVQYLHPQQYHYPTDSILKIMKQMIQQEGVGCLFRGLSASILGISNAVIYFMIYETFKEQIKDRNLLFNSYYVLLASITSKFFASVMTYPLIVIRTIMHDHRTSEQMGLQKVIKYVWNEKGIRGFYGGLKPDLIRLLPSNAIVFMVYQYMKRIL